MVWIFAVVSVALVTIIVELLMVYQKRAGDLRLRQEPLRRRIREHLRSMNEATQKIRRTAAQRLEEMDFEVRYLREQSDELARIFHKMQEELGATATEELADVESAAAEPSQDEGAAAADEQRGALRDANHKREEIDGHLLSMRRDLETVRRTMDRIEARVQRRLGASGGKNGGNDAAKPADQAQGATQ